MTLKITLLSKIFEDTLRTIARNDEYLKVLVKKHTYVKIRDEILKDLDSRDHHQRCDIIYGRGYLRHYDPQWVCAMTLHTKHNYPHVIRKYLSQKSRI